jgi:hypothetical protein
LPAAFSIRSRPWCGNRSTVLVDHARADLDELADGALVTLPCKVAAPCAEPMCERARAGELSRAMRAAYQRARGPAIAGLHIARHHALGLRARIARIDPDHGVLSNWRTGGLRASAGFTVHRPSTVSGAYSPVDRDVACDGHPLMLRRCG